MFRTGVDSMNNKKCCSVEYHPLHRASRKENEYDRRQARLHPQRGRLPRLAVRELRTRGDMEGGVPGRVRTRVVAGGTERGPDRAGAAGRHVRAGDGGLGPARRAVQVARDRARDRRRRLRRRRHRGLDRGCRRRESAAFAEDGSGSDALALSARVAARLCARDGARPELAALYERLAEAARSFGASSRRLRHAYDWDDRNR